MIKLKRVYDKPSNEDGFRVLVDRLWPRGVSKEGAELDLWLGDVAPSPQLRVWFGHKPERFAEFSKRYHEELNGNPAARELEKLTGKHKTTTLLYGAKDPQINHARVLQDFLKK